MDHVELILNRARIVRGPMIAKRRLTKGFVNGIEERQLRIFSARGAIPDVDEAVCFAAWVSCDLQRFRRFGGVASRWHKRTAPVGIKLKTMERALNAVA